MHYGVQWLSQLLPSLLVTNPQKSTQGLQESVSRKRALESYVKSASNNCTHSTFNPEKRAAESRSFPRGSISRKPGSNPSSPSLDQNWLPPSRDPNHSVVSNLPQNPRSSQSVGINAQPGLVGVQAVFKKT